MLGCKGSSGTGVRYKLTLATGLLECLCFAGVVFGWASLVFVLKTDGYFSDLCINVTDASAELGSDCSLQDENFSLVFTVASFMNNFLTLPNGFVYDHFGTMATRFLAMMSCAKSTSYNVEQYEANQDPSSDRGRGVDDEPLETDSLQLTDNSEKDSFKSCVLSWLFLWHLIWLSVMQLRHYFFIGTLNPMLNRLANQDPVIVSEYTNAFAFTQLCGVLFAPWNGLLMDRHKRKPLGSGVSEREADLHSSILSLLLTSLQCLLFSICASIPFLPLQYITFILQVLNRSFLYGGNAAFISIAFPARHFGKLYGLVMSLSAVVSLLQYPCFALNKVLGDPFYVNIILTVLTLMAFIHPVYVFLHCRELAKQRENLQSILEASIQEISMY
ncbi:Solute carrier family 43 member 3 [Anabarilius grahami]|uniref:Solute carrier family 43 member 3 n=1 Tax=Anabarilius grahami TaxID=495550 RepID=A0A3N0XLR6_ANAGA|nr:Solute carrier family 43 member 3 [Anabarilius grahami]